MSGNEEKTHIETETKILIPLIEKSDFKKMGSRKAEFSSIVDAVNSAVELQKTINARASGS